MTAEAGLLIPTLPNLRDVGGHPTGDGARVRRNLLFRSTDLSRLDGPGAEMLGRLGLRTVFDLRTAGEREASPDRLPGGVDLLVLDVLRDSGRPTPAEMQRVLTTPGAAERALGGGRAERYVLDAYREFVDLPSAREAFGRLLRELGAAARRPALFHCTTGKDRTGWAAATLLLFLGVPTATVLDDYLRSGPVMASLFAPYLAAFAALGGDPELLRPLVDVRAEYLDAALQAVSRSFGTIERYVADGLGLDPPTRSALREAFLEPA
jgi:protein-tyrosine phosphatase